MTIWLLPVCMYIVPTAHAQGRSCRLCKEHLQRDLSTAFAVWQQSVQEQKDALAALAALLVRKDIEGQRSTIRHWRIFVQAARTARETAVRAAKRCSARLRQQQCLRVWKQATQAMRVHFYHDGVAAATRVCPSITMSSDRRATLKVTWYAGGNCCGGQGCGSCTPQTGCSQSAPLARLGTATASAQHTRESTGQHTASASALTGVYRLALMAS